MTTQTLHTENIHNLTSIWKSIGQIYQAHTSTLDMEWVDMQDKTWPNRLWLTSPVTPQRLEQAKQHLQSTSTQILIPYYSTASEPTEALFNTSGFKALFHQIGMSLKLDHPFQVESSVQLKRVITKEDAKLWSTFFEQSFGYFISPDTIADTCHSIEYYITYSDKAPIGTLILHTTNSIIGVHAMGIIPEMRRKGYAEQIMKTIINQSIKRGLDYMTLQASEVGKKVYDKLGFTTDFVLNTYGLDE